MSLTIDAVVSARHLARYQRLCDAQRRHAGEVSPPVLRGLWRCGIPALAPVMAMIGILARSGGPSFVTTALLLVTLGLVYNGVRPAFHAFDLMRYPSRQGLVAGTVLYHLPWLVYCGAMMALTIALSAAGVHATFAGKLLIVTAFLVPIATGLRGGAQRVLDRAGEQQVGQVMMFLVFILAKALADKYLPDVSSWLVGGLAAACTVGAMGAAWLVTLRELSFTLVGLACVFFPVADVALKGVVENNATAVTLCAIGLGMAVFLVVSELLVQLKWVDRLEVTRSRSGDGAVSEHPDAPVVLRKHRAGTGLGAARLAYLHDEWTDDVVTSNWSVGFRGFINKTVVFAFTYLRGPVLAVIAVLVSGEGSGTSTGGVVFGLALFAAILATRRGSVDGFELEERLWLLGIDYRDQVMLGLRRLATVGAAPTLAAAIATWLATGPSDSGRLGAVVVIAAGFVLRAGLVGYPPFRETNRLRPGLLLTVVAGGAMAWEQMWTGDLLVYGTIVCAVFGAIGLALRFVRMGEPFLRDCVREY